MIAASTATPALAYRMGFHSSGGSVAISCTTARPVLSRRMMKAIDDPKVRAVTALALFGALQATFSDVHPYCDQVVQNNQDAANKGKPGWVGRRACARHVATYSAGQLIAAVGVT